ncbi:MAG: carboxypeptidase regulatory-like domain-containing protein [Acidobacteria bacterium]|nr:carboxypeptidase regulatory-like domain-containing protein [Acidobacteriota bacterium]
MCIYDDDGGVGDDFIQRMNFPDLSVTLPNDMGKGGCSSYVYSGWETPSSWQDPGYMIVKSELRLGARAALKKICEGPEPEPQRMIIGSVKNHLTTNNHSPITVTPHSTEKKLIKGCIKDKITLQPIKGVKVSVIKGKATSEDEKAKAPIITVTNDTGDFYLECDYDDAILVVDAEGYAIARRALIFNKGEAVKYKEIELSPASIAKGGIRDRVTKAPVKAANVIMAMISPFEAEIKTVATDDSGSYEAERLPDGKKYIVIMAEGYNAETREFELASSEVRSGVDFELTKAGSISGYVVDKNGNPVNGAHIEIVYKDLLPSSPLKFNYWHTGTIETIYEGFFYVGNIQSWKRFVIEVTHNDYKPFKSPLLSLKPGEEAEGLKILLEGK